MATAAQTSLRVSSIEVLAAMERVADWQLEHPTTFELRWRNGERRKDHYARIGWDGTIYRQLELPAQDEPKVTVPKAWRELSRIARFDEVGFAALPKAVQEAWLRESNVGPDALLGVHVLDGSSTCSWEMGTLLHGLIALQRISTRPVYRAAVREVGELNHWSLGPRIYHADDHCVGYAYLEFAEAEHDPLLLAAVQGRFDWIRTHPPHQNLDIRHGQSRWTWSDALFMAPPVWVKLAQVTGDQAYLDFMDKEWWSTVEALFSEEENLFYRDATYLDRHEANGRPVFWSRGNGWVLASLALMLEDLPAGFPTRPRYEQLFRVLARRVADLQLEDGLWRSSLLDPAAHPLPEASGTAFFCYAFARGVRLKLLDPVEYTPRAYRAWIALQQLVTPDGRLGGIQQPGAGPGSAGMESTAPYGVGAFLMAGSEIYRLSAATAQRQTATTGVAPK